MESNCMVSMREPALTITFWSQDMGWEKVVTNDVFKSVRWRVFTLITWWVGWSWTPVGGLRLPKVLKNMIWQCFPSEICEQVSSESVNEHTRAWSGRSLSETKGDYDKGQGDHEAVRRKDSAWQQKRGTDLKMKRQIRPRRITIELLANVKGTNVILHGLRPLPINRWTELPYCSRWLGIRFLHHACTLIFHQTEGTSIICYCEHGNANKNKLMIMFILFFVFRIWILSHHLLCLQRFFLHNLHPEFIISEGK
jgi:hypothetical protein